MLKKAYTRYSTLKFRQPKPYRITLLPLFLHSDGCMNPFHPRQVFLILDSWTQNRMTYGYLPIILISVANLLIILFAFAAASFASCSTDSSTVWFSRYPLSSSQRDFREVNCLFNSAGSFLALLESILATSWITF